MQNPKLKAASERLLIVDFGSQVTQLVARRVRETGVYCEIHPWHNVTLDLVRSGGFCGLILSGGPDSMTQEDSPRIAREILETGLPVLGICYGMQFMCAVLGGSVEPCNIREFGRSVISVQLSTPLTKGVWDKGGMHVVWMSHGDKVASLPDGFLVIASSEGAPFAAAGDPVRQLYGVQFHPEVTHTPDGVELIRNFVIGVCGCSGTWTMSRFLTNSVEAIRAQVGEHGRVICAVSGGVDSTVTAALIHRAIGDRLTCIFVDTGLLRKDEAATVQERFEQIFHIKIHSIDASELFLSRLAGVTDPERKRKIIGTTFIEVFEREAERSGGAEFLAQGTLYPDVIESVSVHGKASVIKSHHNVGGLPERMNMKLVEPLRELFKDEVRALGLELGLHEDLVRRHPFPGPGLAIRIPGEVTAEKADILREADAVFLELIRKEGLYHEIWQAFVALLPVKAVGVMGDARTYEYACALRAVTSSDGMTADAYDFSPAFLRRCASEIINKVKGINRVLVDFTSKPPGTIEWE